MDHVMTSDHIKERHLHNNRYLACERKRIYQLLMISAGMMGAYTYLMRGGVFCNAQTANVVLMAMAIGNGNWQEGLYFLIPISAYTAGAIVSEFFPSSVSKMGLLRWDTYLIGAEILVLFGIGFIPLTVTHRVVQVLINFIASMQYNTFREAEGVPMSTTFCTNHIRQIGTSVAWYFKDKDFKHIKRALAHISMIIYFLAGGIILTALCGLWQEKTIWIATIPLLVCFLVLAHADIFEEHNRLEEIPKGHEFK